MRIPAGLDNKVAKSVYLSIAPICWTLGKLNRICNELHKETGSALYTQNSTHFTNDLLSITYGLDPYLFTGIETIEIPT
jgi:hypothetical protein